MFAEDIELQTSKLALTYKCNIDLISWSSHAHKAKNYILKYMYPLVKIAT